MPLTAQQKQYATASARGAALFFLLSLPQTYMYSYQFLKTVPGTVAAAGVHASIYFILTFLLLTYWK
jgi:hypothetical protein